MNPIRVQAFLLAFVIIAPFVIVVVLQFDDFQLVVELTEGGEEEGSEEKDSKEDKEGEDKLKEFTLGGYELFTSESSFHTTFFAHSMDYAFSHLEVATPPPRA